ncbi:hypothetical protein MXD63_36180 [Frankia sp. Cpl3]|nr:MULTISPECIES: hypothetical protein [Paenibacillaceae]MCK9905414.1 hypothetical protein [Frankia sp. Cpl3]MEC0371183.1 hypothetical protein [Paenibacillus chibensis]
MLHAKVMVVDEETAVVCSANYDFKKQSPQLQGVRSFVQRRRSAGTHGAICLPRCYSSRVNAPGMV